MFRQLRLGASALSAILIWFAPAAMVHAQAVAGEVVEQGSAAPVRGVFVALLEPDGQRVAGALTDDRGRFRLTAPAAGTYTLRADRIGYRTVFSPPMELDQGVTHSRIELESRPIPLARVDAEAEGRACAVRPDQATRLQEIWDQIRIALDVAAWTQATGYLRSEHEIYERLIDPISHQVRSEGARRRGMVDGTFTTRPAEDLVGQGFIRRDGDDLVFFGLDAATIVSDAFLETHCFRLRAPGPGREGLIGLAFEPVRDRSWTGLRGVLWLDERSAELRVVEYAYTLLPWRLPAEIYDLFGGETEFRRLPNGAWIAQRWAIRMPQVRRVPPDLRGSRRPLRAVLAILTREFGLMIREEGGEVAAIHTAAGLRLPGPERATLEGAVHDSIGGGPLAGARVWLEGTAYEATTDDRGHYRMDDLSAGVYALTFAHPVLDEWGLEPPVREVALDRGDVTAQELAVPSVATVLASGCRDAAGAVAGGAVVGRVLDAGSGAPVLGATVSLRLPDREPELSLETRTDASGVYRFCDIDGEGSVVLSADVLGRGRTEATRPLPAEVPLFHEFGLELDLPARLIGQVVDAETGQPVRGVSIQLEGAGSAQVTGRDGRFLFRRVEPGAHVIEARHVAYEPVRDTVRVDGAGRTMHADVRLSTRPITLDPVVVSVAARPTTGILGSAYDRIERVRLFGGGTVFDREDLRRRKPARISHLLSGILGVRIVQVRSRGRTVPLVSSTRAFAHAFAGGSGICPLAVYLDGAHFPLGDLRSGDLQSIDDLVPTSQLEAVEVYSSVARIPREFWGSNAGCGVIAIWTRRGG